MAEAKIHVSLYDGARLPLDPTTEVLLTVRPQYRSEHVFSDFLKGNNFQLGVPVPEDGSGFAILASARGYEDAGVSPVMVKKNQIEAVHLMLLGRNATFQFARARWERLSARPSLLRFLMGFETDVAQVGARYTDLLEFQPQSLACLLNIATALDLLAVSNPSLGFRTPLDYLKAIEWGAGIRQDRFFALASQTLLPDVRKAAAKNLFEEEKNPGLFHAGASESYKQIEFGEANVQITFHDKVFHPGANETLIRTELDMDYYRDVLSHALLEVIPNTLSGGQRKTSPRQIYVMRWIAAQAHGQDFDPLYTIA